MSAGGMPPLPAPSPPYPELPPGGWSVEKIRSAITDLERGYLKPASRLTRALSRHPRYVQGRDQFVGAVQGCPAEILPAQVTYGGKGMARSLAEGAGQMLAQVLRDGTERWFIEWFKVMPLVIGVLAWDTVSRPWRPVSLTRWPFDAVRLDLHRRELWAQTADGRELPIVGGDGTWVVGWGGGVFNLDHGLIRCLGEAWIRGIGAARDVANRSQASGVAAVIQGVPEGTDMTLPSIPIYEEHLRNLQRGGAAGIITPPGWSPPSALDLATKNGAPALELALKTSTTDLLVPWLMQDGTATNEGGSLAKAQVLDGVLFSAVAGLVGALWGEVTADGSHVAGIFTEQIVRPWVRYQLAEGARDQGDAPEMPSTPVDRVCPLALRRVPDFEEDERLAAQAARAVSFWAEVEMTESKMRRDLTADELTELASSRGVVVPASVLRERGSSSTESPDRAR